MSEQQHMLEIFFDQMPMGIALLDCDLRLRRFNPTLIEFVRRYSSLPTEQVRQGTSFLDLLPGNEASARAIFLRALAGETVYQEAFPLTINGRVSYWDSVSAPLYHEATLVGIVHVTTSVTERVLAEHELQKTLDRLRHHVTFEQIITTLSNSFINRPPDQIDHGIRQALQTIGTFTQADRAYIFLYSDDATSLSCIQEWCAEGIEAQIHRLQGLSTADLAWSNQQLLQRQILHIPWVDQLPPEAAVEQREFTSQGIKSLLAVPMTYQERVVGLLGFDAVRHEKTWAELDISVLHVVGEMLINALEHKRSRAALYEANRLLEQRVAERTYELEQRNQELERRRQVAEGLREILVRLNAEHALPQLLDAIVAQADQLLASDAVALYLLHEEQQTLTIQALRGDLPPEVRQVTLPSGVGTIGRVVASRQIMIVPDVRQLNIRTVEQAQAESLAAIESVLVDPARLEALKAALYRFRAVLALPLVAQDVAYGGLAFYYCEPRTFTDEEINLASLFADQAALALQNARLRDKAEQIAVMAERNRLARELHDAVTQTLFSASLIADVLPRIWERDPVVGEAKLAELRELTRGALAEMRTLLLELRPATLTESNLDELLHQLAAAFVGRSRLQITVEVEGEAEQRLPPEIQVALYRIAQEALNNVVKHASASHVVLTLTFTPGHVVLTVQDDGRGFDATTVRSHSLGLGIMRERAAKIGARLEMTSRIGMGTRIAVDVLT
ncbi:GAF domain-containing protein [Candidatus Chloroploca asiatica]|nr:GAF domain-containing protein [Candidatus Chloroploca asiatica]